MRKRKVILRADGSPYIGFGHLYRMIALAQHLNEDFDCTFISHLDLPFVAQELNLLENVTFAKVPEVGYRHPDTRNKGDEVDFDMSDHLTGDEIVVLDGYWFGKKYQQSVKQFGGTVVYVDDLIENNFAADVIINHSPGIDRTRYHLPPSCKLFTGIEYLLIRKAFYDIKVETNHRIKSIFVSLGGIDAANLSSHILMRLKKESDFNKIHVVYSDSFSRQNIMALNQISKELPERVFLYKGLNAKQLIELLDGCTHAITSASSVCFEVILRGLKPLIVVTASNQTSGAHGLVNENLVYLLNNVEEQVNENSFQNYLAADQHFQSLKTTNKLNETFKAIS